MPVCQRDFSWAVLRYLFTSVAFILRWFLYCATGTAGPFIPTSKELQKPWELWLAYCLSPVYLVGALILMFPACVAFIIRYFLHQLRTPYCFSTVLEERAWNKGMDRTRNEVNSRLVAECYTFSTMNLCLLPELGSKVNNLDKTEERARRIGERIVIDQFFFTNLSQNQTHRQNGYTKHSSNRRLKNNLKTAENAQIISHFSHLDFICFQETFDRDCVNLLIRELHKVFPWVIYDAGICGIRANLCGLNSGLMVASRYKILDVDFKHFEIKTGLDHVCNKGLLMVKVSLEDGVKDIQPCKVGYIFNTHLQAFQGDKPISERQLDCVLEWTAKFRDETSCQSDRVVFDVLCGDFNFDNLSPGEVHLGNHKFFSTYVDVCRIRPGEDEDWTVGTEMRIPTLQDEAVATPDGLKRVLQNPYLRQQYMIDADIQTTTMSAIYKAVAKKDKHGNIIYSPVGGKRRIDGILYRDDGSLEVKKYHFVTRLASLTDHIPVSMTITSSSS